MVICYGGHERTMVLHSFGLPSATFSKDMYFTWLSVREKGMKKLRKAQEKRERKQGCGVGVGNGNKMRRERKRRKREKKWNKNRGKWGKDGLASAQIFGLLLCPHLSPHRVSFFSPSASPSLLPHSVALSKLIFCDVYIFLDSSHVSGF